MAIRKEETVVSESILSYEGVDLIRIKQTATGISIVTTGSKISGPKNLPIGILIPRSRGELVALRGQQNRIMPAYRQF